MSAIALTLVGLAPAHADEPQLFVGTPSLEGELRVGETVYGHVIGHSEPEEADTYTIIWFIDGVAVAEGPTFTLKPEHVHKEIYIVTRATKVGYADSYSGPTPSTPQDVYPGIQASFTPKISGALATGNTLKVAGLPTGATFSYQWLRGGKAISKANKATYKLVAADVGKKISVRVTSKRAGYNNLAKISAATAAIKKGFTKSPAPKISGTAKVGNTLTAKTASWSPTARFKLQWYRDGVAIAKATKATYKVVAADEGKKLTVKVTGSKSGYLNVAKTSAATKVVGKGTVSAPKPKITGTAKVGVTLKVSLGKVSPSGVSKKYQWLRNGSPIAAATKSSYALKNLDAGKKITVKVTYSKAGYTSKTVTSAATKAVAKRPAATAANGYYKVTTASGKSNIKPGTYYVTSAKDDCVWAREKNKVNTDGAITWGSGPLLWIVTVLPSDKYFYTRDCGAWYPYDGTAVLASSYKYDGVFRVGVHLPPGEYRVSGSNYEGFECTAYFMNKTTLGPGDFDDSVVVDAGETFVIYPHHTWVATFNCGGITRVGGVP